MICGFRTINFFINAFYQYHNFSSVTSCRMHLYISVFILLLIRNIGPIPYQEKHPQTITLPPPCFTVFKVSMGLFSWFGGTYIWSHIHFSIKGKSVKLWIVGPQHTLRHHESFLPLCLLADLLRTFCLDTCGFFLAMRRLSSASRSLLLIVDVDSLTSTWLDNITFKRDAGRKGSFLTFLRINWSKPAQVSRGLPRFSDFGFVSFDFLIAFYERIFAKHSILRSYSLLRLDSIF